MGAKTVDRTIVHDALTGSAIAFDEHACALLDGADQTHAHTAARSLFFPGCSVINFAPSLMGAVYAMLERAGEADGISLLCCGKLLAFEPDAENVCPAFEADLLASLRNAGVKRVITACPNCTAELRRVLAKSEEDLGIEVAVLPEVLGSCGIGIGEEAVRSFFDENGMAYAGAAPKLTVQDSCPDRKTGEFARGTRSLLPAGSVVEMEHSRTASMCCGSLAKAAGKNDAATRQSQRRGEEGVAAGADAIVTACMSCASQLSNFQDALPVIHYLELLCNERIDWASLPPYLQVRFLFETHSGRRDYRGLADASPGCCGAVAADCAEASEAGEW